MRPGQHVRGIVLKARNDCGWGPASFPEQEGRASSAPPGQIDWLEVVETSTFTASLRWSQPSDDNGAAVQNYRIKQHIPGLQESEMTFETGSGDGECIVGALQPGTPYLFFVAAQNESGWGPFVKLPAFGVTKPAPPQEPTDFKVVRCSPPRTRFRIARVQDEVEMAAL